MLKLLRTLLLLFIALYCAGLGAYLLLRLVAGDAFWWLALLHTFALYLFVPLVVALPLAFILRSRPLSGWTTLFALSAAVWFVLPAFMPKTIPAHSETSLKVVAYNLLGVPRSLNADIDWLLSTNADVIFLEEVVAIGEDPRLSRLKAVYPHEARVDGAQRIFSRLPLQSTTIIWLEDPEPGRVAIKAVVEWDDQPVSLYAIHLSLPQKATPHVNTGRFPFNRLPVGKFPFSFMLHYDETRRNNQIDRLLTVLRTDPHPVIVAGDFNLNATSVMYGRIAAVLRDTHAESGTGFGHTWAESSRIGAPAWLPPLLRIDYIWHSAELVALSHIVAPPLGSDHLPIVAELAWRK